MGKRIVPIQSPGPQSVSSSRECQWQWPAHLADIFYSIDNINARAVKSRVTTPETHIKGIQSYGIFPYISKRKHQPHTPQLADSDRKENKIKMDRKYNMGRPQPSCAP